MSHAAAPTDDIDALVADTTAKLQRSRRRMVMLGVGIVVAIGAVMLGVYLMRARRCFFVGPVDGSSRFELVGKGRTRVTAENPAIALLRPGSHDVVRDGEKASIWISPINQSHVYVPATPETCFVVAGMEGFYGEGSLPSVYRVTQAGETASAGLFPDDLVEDDVCALPLQKKILTHGTIVQPVACAAAPKSKDEASRWLVERAIACRR